MEEDRILVRNNIKYWDFIRLLRNNPEVRKGFIEQVDITMEQQREYMSQYEKCYYVCLVNHQPVGYIGAVDGDIRIAVMPVYQRKGIGKFMLDEFVELNIECWAKIKLENLVTKRLFDRCGFKQINKDNRFYYYDLQKH